MSGIMMATFMAGATVENPFLGIPASITGEDIEVGANAVVTLTFYANGTWWMDGNTQNANGTWMSANGTSSNYDIYNSLSGWATGTINTWLNLGTDRVWTKVQSGGGSSLSSGSNTLQIRQAASPFSVLDTASLSVRVERT